ncbi:MAG: fructose-1 6-bisphosphatase II [Rhodospirillaceae bacterium]|nr:MAG: fructose-1 6-bisphosphatase II [Rhodospirillaceae bacterium]
MPEQPEVPVAGLAYMDRNLALEAMRVTEAAALAAAAFVGKGDDRAADLAAVQAAHGALNGLAINGIIVLGERDSPLLFPGERLGIGVGPQVDIAIDPLEGNTITAKGGANALSIVAIAEAGSFLVPHTAYMDKLIVGPGLPADVVDLDRPVADNLHHLAQAKGVKVSDLLVYMLDRPRHQALMAEVRKAGARVMLILDGDVAAGIATCDTEAGIDLFIGRGGAAEGVLTAAALRCIGGQMQGRLVQSAEAPRGWAMGAAGDRIYTVAELARGDVMFAATGVTDSAMLKGVRRCMGGAITNSLVMRSKSGTVRRVQAHHDFTHKADYGLRGC